MCTLGAFAGYHVTVIDARAVFATRARFPDADDVVVMWPHRFLETAPVDHRTVLAVLTHDEKFDIPLLALALRSDAAYIGAMGSRATHERRVALLREQGTTAAEAGTAALPDRPRPGRAHSRGDRGVDPRRDDEDDPGHVGARAPAAERSDSP